MGDGSDKEAVQLEPAVLAPAVFAASRDGVVKAVGRATGKLRWKRDFKEGITGGVGAGDGVVALGTAQAELLLLDARDG
ncbi:PQQ-binding-like beta-propeller repeat protein, partial [Acinetobacter baumannii]